MRIYKALENCKIAKFVEIILYQKLESTKSSHMQALMFFMSKFCSGIIKLAPNLSQGLEVVTFRCWIHGGH